jgi:hypothetical protein
MGSRLLKLRGSSPGENENRVGSRQGPNQRRDEGGLTCHKSKDIVLVQRLGRIRDQDCRGIRSLAVRMTRLNALEGNSCR